MAVKLHLMNDRKIIATETVGGNLQVPFRKLMDSIIKDIDENYVSDYADVFKDAVSVMKREAEYAKRHPPTRERITEFSTGDPASSQQYYSVVLHAITD